VGSPAGVIGGKLFDRFGSYAPAFELNILVSAIGVLALAFAHMPKHQTHTEAVPLEALPPGASPPR